MGNKKVHAMLGPSWPPRLLLRWKWAQPTQNIMRNPKTRPPKKTHTLPKKCFQNSQLKICTKIIPKASFYVKIGPPDAENHEESENPSEALKTDIMVTCEVMGACVKRLCVILNRALVVFSSC